MLGSGFEGIVVGLGGGLSHPAGVEPVVRWMSEELRHQGWGWVVVKVEKESQSRWSAGWLMAGSHR